MKSKKRDPKEPAGDIEVGLAHTIRLLRVQQEMSQKVLAAKAGFSWSYMSSIELGRRSVGIGIIAKLADALNISMSEMLRCAEAHVVQLKNRTEEN